MNINRLSTVKRAFIFYFHNSSKTTRFIEKKVYLFYLIAMFFSLGVSQYSHAATSANCEYYQLWNSFSDMERQCIVISGKTNTYRVNGIPSNYYVEAEWYVDGDFKRSQTFNGNAAPIFSLQTTAFRILEVVLIGEDGKLENHRWELSVIPGNPSSLTARLITKDSADISWVKGGSAHTTELQYKKNSSNSWRHLTKTQLVNASLSSLMIGTFYDVRMRSLSENEAAAGDWITFSKIFKTKEPPPKVASVSPVNNSGNVSISSNLSWTSVTDTNGDTVEYNVYFGTSGSPPWVTSQSSTSYNASLNGNTRYYWRIDSYDSDGITQGDVNSFVTASIPPDKVVNSNPVNNATELPISIKLTWERALDDDGDTVSYYVCLGKSPSPDCSASDQTTTEYQTSELEPSSRYYWRVDSWDGDKRTTGDTWSFTTKDVSYNAGISSIFSEYVKYYDENLNDLWAYVEAVNLQDDGIYSVYVEVRKQSGGFVHQHICKDIEIVSGDKYQCEIMWKPNEAGNYYVYGEVRSINGVIMEGSDTYPATKISDKIIFEQKPNIAEFNLDVQIVKTGENNLLKLYITRLFEDLVSYSINMIPINCDVSKSSYSILPISGTVPSDGLISLNISAIEECEYQLVIEVKSISGLTQSKSFSLVVNDDAGQSENFITYFKDADSNTWGIGIDLTGVVTSNGSPMAEYKNVKFYKDGNYVATPPPNIVALAISALSINTNQQLPQTNIGSFYDDDYKIFRPKCGFTPACGAASIAFFESSRVKYYKEIIEKSLLLDDKEYLTSKYQIKGGDKPIYAASLPSDLINSIEKLMEYIKEAHPDDYLGLLQKENDYLGKLVEIHKLAAYKTDRALAKDLKKLQSKYSAISDFFTLIERATFIYELYREGNNNYLFHEMLAASTQAESRLASLKAVYDYNVSRGDFVADPAMLNAINELKAEIKDDSYAAIDGLVEALKETCLFDYMCILERVVAEVGTRRSLIRAIFNNNLRHSLKINTASDSFASVGAIAFNVLNYSTDETGKWRRIFVLANLSRLIQNYVNYSEEYKALVSQSSTIEFNNLSSTIPADLHLLVYNFVLDYYDQLIREADGDWDSVIEDVVQASAETAVKPQLYAVHFSGAALSFGSAMSKELSEWTFNEEVKALIGDFNLYLGIAANKSKIVGEWATLIEQSLTKPDFLFAPEFSISGGQFNDSVTFALYSNVSNASIRYTTNGSTPTRSNGILINNGDEIDLTESANVKAIAYTENLKSSGNEQQFLIIDSRLPSLDLEQYQRVYVSEGDILEIPINRLNASLSEPLEISLSLTGSAVQKEDYLISSDLVFPENEKGARLVIAVSDDDVVEQEESIQITLTGEFVGEVVMIDVRIINTTSENKRPQFENQIFEAVGGVEFNESLVADDPENNSLSFIAKDDSLPAGVTLVVRSDGSFTFTSVENFSGEIIVPVSVSDGFNPSVVAYLIVLVSPNIEGQNRPPEIIGQYKLDVTLGNTVTGQLVALDKDSDPITFVEFEPTQHGTLTLNGSSGEFSYQADNNFIGNVEFAIRANDGELYSAIKYVSIRVLEKEGANNTPIANAAVLTTLVDTPKIGNLLGTDLDNDQLLYEISELPNFGNVDIINAQLGSFLYTPGTGFVGNDTFKYKVFDGYGYSQDGIVTVTVSESKNKNTVLDWPYYRQNVNASLSSGVVSLPQDLNSTVQWSSEVVGATTFTLVGNVDSTAKLEVVSFSGKNIRIFDSQGVQINSPITVPQNIYQGMLGDIDDDGIYEIFAGSFKQSSLNIYIYKSDGTLFKTLSAPRNGGNDSYMYPEQLLDSNRLLVRYNSGYAKEPRGFAVFDISSGEELWYYDIGPIPTYFSVANIDNDSELEITSGVFTPHNGASGSGVNGENTSTSDGNLYTIIIDENGNEELTQLLGNDTNGGSNGSADAIFSDLGFDGTVELVTTVAHYSSYPGDAQIRILDSVGNLLHQRSVGTNNQPVLIVADIESNGSQEIIANLRGTGEVVIYNNSLEPQITATLNIGHIFAIDDLNGDGFKDILGRDKVDGSILKVISGADGELIKTYNFDSNIRQAMIVDVNNDGYSDIVVNIGGFISLITGQKSSGYDADFDNVFDNLDNCPLIPNPGQENTDLADDGGDACDDDDDNDNILDSEDAFPFVSIGDLLDTDIDGAPNECDDACAALGMAADLDDDNDGVADVTDAYPLIALGDLRDFDSDGAPNECDTSCISLGMAADLDDDNDGVADVTDAYPLIALGDLRDFDSDGAPNECDTSCISLGMAADLDDDNDGVADVTDAYPLIALGDLRDFDSDGAPNECDTSCISLGMAADLDDDNDGVADVTDAYPLIALGDLRDFDSDGAPNECDTSCISLGMAADLDDDNDGVADVTDAYPLIALGDLRDFDSDGAPNECDTSCISLGMAADLDDDNDGVADVTDAYPLIALGDLRDSDSDGAPNECDTSCISLGMAADLDDDNDGVADVTDAYPLIALGDLRDFDSDGAPNECDTSCISLGMAADLDDDNDGVADVTDAYPLIALGDLRDFDSDGAPNECDTSCISLGMAADLDDDNDGVADVTDAYPLIALGDLRDFDSDGAPNECDTSCISLGMAADLDDDNDGVADVTDAYPLIALGDLRDSDSDGAPNECDTSCISLGMAADLDDDNDGVADVTDAYPLIALGDLRDFDSDGAPNECDTSCISLGMAADLDDDNDGVADVTDAYPLIALGDLRDFDSDGAPNECDTSCISLGMAADLDDDNDGVADVTDAYPLIALGDLRDSDSDGAPNECDTSCISLGMAADLDDDNDGVADVTDAYPLIALGDLRDSDSDGAPNECDTSCISLGMAADLDDDNDGVLDADDAYPTDPTKWQNNIIITRHDVNDDGNADILWRNLTDGRNWLWTMSGRSIISSAGINVITDQAWQIVGRGDFDGDGKSDILWRNSNTGRNYIYLMDGHSIKQQGQLNYVRDTNWQVAEVADVDGDGKDDVIWRHATQGRTWIYLMNGMTTKASQGSLTVADLNWEIVATGDVNGDDKADVIWRHKTRGDNYVWLMNGTQIANRYVLNRVTSSNWNIAGAGDLNGDGTDDIIWRNQFDGRNWAYLMNDGQIQTSSLINGVANLNWQIADISDLDGDGKADLFWRQTQSGQSYIYLMNGLNIQSQGYSTTVGTSWQVQH